MPLICRTGMHAQLTPPPPDQQKATSDEDGEA